MKVIVIEKQDISFPVGVNTFHFFCRLLDDPVFSQIW